MRRRGHRACMSLLWIIIIVLLVLVLFGGFGWSRRR
jgi:flagellar basal body-associated protein FliL